MGVTPSAGRWVRVISDVEAIVVQGILFPIEVKLGVGIALLFVVGMVHGGTPGNENVTFAE